MASRIRNIVEPAFGWLFVVIALFAVGLALLAPGRPTMEATGPGRTQIDRAH